MVNTWQLEESNPALTVIGVILNQGVKNLDLVNYPTNQWNLNNHILTKCIILYSGMHHNHWYII